MLNNGYLVIRVFEDRKQWQDSKIRFHHRVDGPQEMIDIHIASQGPKEERLAAFCHELGHAVGTIIDLPNAIQDTRFLGENSNMINTPDVIASEEEAWKVADKIYQAAREWALKSYRENAAQ
jgi:hypothetical protein